MFKQGTEQPAAVGPLTETTTATAGGALRARLLAGATHLVLSIAVACVVLGLVYFAWYPAPLDRISGVGEILLLLLAVDVTLGPLLTTVVFDRRKKSLPLDLACIAVLQLAALAYGLYTVEAGRPHYLVFVKDRFEVVSRADLQADDRAAAAGNASAHAAWFAPRIVAAEAPADAAEREKLMMESVLGGRDVQHFPARYRELATQRTQLAAKAQPLAALREVNPGRDAVLDAAIARAGAAADRLGFVPIKGPKGDAAMLVDIAGGGLAGMVDLAPWR
ncbi:MAG: TfpX/TfpZ family type IV pilin accessory protein [Lautropia sp.]